MSKKVKTHYDNLQVSRNANTEVIRAAYRSLSQRYHPDKHPNNREEAERIMRILNEAYGVLSDPEKRKRHNQWIDEATKIGDEAPKTSSPTTVALGRISPGQAAFRDLPDEVQRKLRDRVDGRIKEQFKARFRGVGRNYFWVAFLCGWFWILFNLAGEFRWKPDELNVYALVSLAVGVLLGINSHSIMRWHLSPLRYNLILTPIYIITTSADRVRYWPLRELKDIRVTHRFQNGWYLGSDTRMEFPAETIDVTINGKTDAEQFLQNLRAYDERVRAAYTRNDAGFFYEEDDFRNVTAQYPKKKPFDTLRKSSSSFMITNHMLAGYGISMIACALLFYVAYRTNVQRPPKIGVPPQVIHSNDFAPAVSDQSMALPQNRFSEPALLLPATGYEKNYVTTPSVAPLRVLTRQNANHYFIKVENWQTGQAIKSFFIRSGQSHEILVPLGSYRVKYASGTTWYGERYLFGPETIYAEADKRFDFIETSDGYSGYTVELIQQRDGNLRTKTISPGQW